MSWVADLHWIRPWWFLALLPLPLVLRWLWSGAVNSGQWQSVCDKHLLPYLNIGLKHKGQRFCVYLILASWVLTVIALAGPSWSRQAQPVYSRAKATVFVLDLSPSMNASDVAPTRLSRARYKLLDLLKSETEGQSALLVFSGEPFLVSPLTEDSKTIASMVPDLSPAIMPVTGNNLSWALKMAGQLLSQQDEPYGKIIVLTDSKADSQDIAEAKALNAQGYHSSVLGFGTAQGGPIAKAGGGFLKNKQGGIEFAQFNPSSLQTLSHAGGGQYFSMQNDNSDVKALLSNSVTDRLHEKSLKRSERKEALWQDEGHWFILAALLFMLLLARPGYLEVIFP